MREPVSLALIGCGGMAAAHVRGLRALWEADRRDFRVVATCDIHVAAAEQRAAELAEFQGDRPTVYDDVQHLLVGCDFEAADICAVHRAHHELAIACFAAGKHVTMEKPLAITLRAGRLILDAAESAGTVFQIAENYRRSPEHRAVRWAIEQGRIGEPWLITWYDVFQRLWHWGWREEKMQAGGGWSLDGGVHFADLFRYHLGPVETLYAQVSARHPIRYRDRERNADPVPCDVEDTTLALLRFASGADGAWIHTNAGFGDAHHRHSIHGSEGSVVFGVGINAGGASTGMADLIAEYRAQLSSEESERLFPGGVTDAVATELHEFLQAVRGQGRVETDGWEGYHAEALSIALYESAALGRPVSLREVEALEVEAYQGAINEDLGLA